MSPHFFTPDRATGDFLTKLIKPFELATPQALFCRSNDLDVVLRGPLSMPSGWRHL